MRAFVLAACCLASVGWPTWGNTPEIAAPRYHLKLLTPASYLPGIPILARVELRRQDESRAQEVWDSVATLSTPTPGIALSTNRVIMKNGLGSTLVTVAQGGDFSMEVALGGLQARRTIMALTNELVTTVSGMLPGTNTVWRGIVKITADVTVPTNGTLTIEPNTLILIAGATSNPTGKDLEVRGRVLAQGTEDQPIQFTAATNGVNWGEVRHVAAAPSLYQWCTFTRAGRGTTGGHTGTAPTFRPTNSKITFESCSFTDNTSGSSTNTIGKVMEATGSDLVVNNCLWARARMGPEISGTALLLTNSYIMEMLGDNDCDGIYLHDQKAGQTITIVDSVFAQGDDDGIDTLGSDITVENCIVRDWKNLAEDSKGISVYGGIVRVSRCLLVDNKCGISGKDEAAIRIYLDRSTVIATFEYALGAFNKSGSMFPSVIDIRATNCILRTLNARTNSLFTSYKPADIHVYFSSIGESWGGATNCVIADPRFIDEAGHDYGLLPDSPCIDAGDPAMPPDPDGSRADVGYFAFVPEAPRLSSPVMPPLGGLQFIVNAYADRNYRIETSTNCETWQPLRTVFQTNASSLFQDLSAPNDALRLYRVKWGP